MDRDFYVSEMWLQDHIVQKKLEVGLILLMLEGRVEGQTRKASKAYCFNFLVSKIGWFNTRLNVVYWCFWIQDVCSLALCSILVTMSTVWKWYLVVPGAATLSALKVILLTVTKGSKNIPTVGTISTAWGLSGHVLLKSKYKKIWTCY